MNRETKPLSIEEFKPKIITGAVRITPPGEKQNELIKAIYDKVKHL